MSLSDHLRYLRAMKEDLGTKEIAEAVGLPSLSPLTQAEQRYQPIPNEDGLIEKLAAYYGRSVDEFHWHNARARRYLTKYLLRCHTAKKPISVTLRTGEVLTGEVEWFDLGAIRLKLENGRFLVVQRHAVVDWEGAAERAAEPNTL